MATAAQPPLARADIRVFEWVRGGDLETCATPTQAAIDGARGWTSAAFGAVVKADYRSTGLALMGRSVKSPVRSARVVH